MASFFSGICFATFAASGLLFLKSWKETRERFFLLFAFACWMLAFERLPLLFLASQNETASYVYLFRLTAFILILVAIVNANRTNRE